MKKLIEEYGQALVAIVVAIIFSILVFSFAYPMMAKSSKNTTDRAGRSDWSSRTASALPTIKAAVKPSISANSAYIDYGARFNIKNYVTAYDANGVSLINNVSIYSITTTKLDDNGKTINVTKKATKSSPLTFDTTKPGIYIVKYQVYARETALSKYVIYSYANAKYVVSSNKKSSTESLDTERFRAYASQYQPTKVVFIASLANAPPDTTDVSVAQNDSIQAWMDGDVLYVAQSGGVVASKNCSKLFYSGTVNGWQSKITEIDMSYLIEANITNTYQMFKDCSSLEHIYVYSDWDTTNISTSTEMFKNDFNLQGYQGTTYDDSYTDVTRAHLDNGTTQPGYFSVFQIVTKRTNGSATYTGTATNGGAKVEVLNPASGAEVKYGTTRGTYNYTSVPTYTNAGTYVVYFKVTASKFDDVEGELTIHIEKADSIISTPSAKSLEYNGKAQALINSVTSSHGTIQYKLSTSSTYSSSIPTATTAGTYTVNVKFTPDSNHNSLPVQNVTAKIKKATISYTKEPEANTVTYNGKAQELVTAGKVTNGTLQYSQDQTNWSTNVPTATNAGEYTVYYRTKGDSNYEDTPVEKLVATITKKEVELTVTNGLATYDGNPTDGGAKVTVTNPSSGATVKYGKDDENFIYSSIPKYSEVGSYTVYYKVTADNYFSQQGFFTITINPAVSKTMIPTAISGLIYNKKDQKLLTAGTSQDGTFYYSTDYKEDDTAEDNTAAINAATWTTTVPTGKNAGKYNIYWRFAGNDGFSDIAPTLITGEIGKADITINMSSTSGTLTYPNTSISFNVSLSTDEVEYNYVDNVEDEIDRIVTITRNGNNFTLNWVPNSEGKMLEGDVGVLIITNGNENYNFTMDSFKVTTEYGTIKSTSTDGKATYNGSATNGGASVTVTEPSTGYTIKYGKTEGTYDLDSIPTYTNAGTHTVYYKISAENYKDKTGKLNIVINKKTAVVTTAPKARDLTYNGSAQALVTAGTTNNGTLQYSLDNKNWSTKIPTGTNAGTYDVYYKVVGDSNHSDSTPVKLTVTIATGTIDAYATNGNTTYTGNATNGGAKVTVITPTSGYTIKYGTSSGGYDSATIPTFVDAGTHTVYYQVTAPNYSAYNGRFDIIINKANASVTKVPTAKTLTYNGSSQELVNAGTGTGGTFKYSTDNANWSTTISSKTAAGTYTVYYKVIGDSNHNDSTVGSVKVAINTKAMKVTATNGSATYTGTATNGGAKVTATDPTSGYTVKYGTTSGSYTLNSIPTYINAGSYTVYYQVTATNYTTFTGSLTIAISTKAVSISVTNGAAVYSGNATNGGAKVTVSDPSSGATVKYGTTSGTYNLTTVPTYTNAGTYTIYYQVTATNYASKTGSLTITISKADAKVTKVPTAKSLVYTGSAQELVTAGAGTGGTFKYSTDGTNWSASIPTKTPAGTYTVYYKVTGDSNHNDSAIGQLTVKIVEKYSITYELNGGSVTGNPASYTPNDSFTLKNPTKANNTFVGWATGFKTETVLMGDVDGDGTVSASDIQKIISNNTSDTLIDERTFMISDVNGDGIVDELDRNILMSQVVGKSENITKEITYAESTSDNVTISKGTTGNKKYYAIWRIIPKTITVSETNGSATYTGNATNGGAKVTVSEPTSGYTIKYSTDSRTAYPLTSMPTFTNAGSHRIYYQVTASGYETISGILIVTINKADAKVTKAPTAKVLNYNGSAQALVNAGTGTGGTFKYSTDGTNWSSNIPTKTEVGTYTVYYKVIGDSNHNDSAIGQLTVTIEEAKTYTLCSGWDFKDLIPSTATSIEFTSEIAPSGAVLTDVTEAKDNSVVAWLNGTVWKVSSQTSDKKVILNENSGNMFERKNALTKILFNNIDTSNVTNMNYMFKECESLTLLDLSTFNTKNVVGMHSMFQDCSSLETLKISNFDTSKVEDMGYMFYFCSKLTNLDVSNFDTSNVTNTRYMFGVCSKLASIDVSNFDTSNVTDMGGMFYFCSNVKILNTSRFNTSKATDMSGMFSSCSNLTSLDVSRFNTSNVKMMEGMFYNCSNLTSLDVSNFDTSNYNLSTMDSMFEKCSKLTVLDLSNFDTSPVTSMDNMFNDCSNLKTIYVSDLWTVSKISNSGNAIFNNCPKIVGQSGTTYDSSKTDATMANYENGYLTYKAGPYTLVDGNSFRGKIPSNATSIVFTDTKAPSGTSATDLSSANDNTVVGWLDGTTYYVSSQKTGQKVIGNSDCSNMFSYVKSLTSLRLSNFDTSKVTNMSHMFEGCSKLTSLYLSSFDTSKVTDMSGMFNACDNLTFPAVSNWDTSNVTDMSDMFTRCSNLTSLNLSKWNTSNVTDMSCMFHSCYNLNSLDISNFDTSNVKNMYGMFDVCINLTSLDVSSFDTSKVTDMNNMFESCPITSLDLSNFNTSNVTDMSGMFCSCSNLETIYVSDLWNISKVDNSISMFDSCSKLVGQSGTTYDSSKTDATMANYENGYLTYKAGPYTLVDGDWFNDQVPSSATSIIFTDIKAPSGTSTTALSFANDNSVVGWLDGTTWYVSTQKTGKKVIGNNDCARMFHYCSDLTSLDLSNFDTSNVANMSNMFNGCSNLTSLDLSNFDTRNVADMSDMFSGCSQINTIYVSALWNTSNVTSSSNMFSKCTNIEGYYSIKYNSSKTDKSMANYTTGYLQEKNNSTAMHIEVLFNNSVRDKITRYVPSNLTFEKLIQAGLFGSAGKIHNGTVSVVGQVSNCYLHKKDSAGNKTYVGSSEYPRTDVTYWYDVLTGY